MHERCVRALNPEALRNEIRAAIGAGELDPAFPSGGLAASPVAIKKDRFTVYVEAADADGQRLEVVAKGYWDDERAARVLANHRRLWETDLGRGEGTIRTSRPYGLLAPLGVTLTERVPGEHPRPDDVNAAERAARAAALLHSCGADVEPLFELDAALANVERHARLLERRAAAIAARAQALAKHARSLESRFEDAPRSPLNGDFSLGSLLLDGERTYLIDWDIACSFDAAWDVGNYLVQLFRTAREDGQDPTASREAFLAEYRAAAATDASFEERVRFHEALVAIHKTYTVVRIGAADAEPLASGLLDLAAARLAELG